MQVSFVTYIFWPYNFIKLELKYFSSLQGSGDDESVYGGAWCAESEEKNHWFEVDARREVEFTGVITQGRNSDQQWVVWTSSLDDYCSMVTPWLMDVERKSN